MINFPYCWHLQSGYPAKNIENHRLKVFGTFVCGGGSTMGYKLAGYNHLGGVEIDKQIAPIYKFNHNPKYLYNEDIRDFRVRKDLPQELFELDILDGSPPCSVFSTAGKREEGWGVQKTFREGQTKQSLDDLFFEYIALAKKLQPKVVVAENVKGMLIGNAKIYCKKIQNAFNQAGYNVQLFLCNAATMGVPQKRERVFFIAKRKDLNFPKLNLTFQCNSIPFEKISDEFDRQEFEIGKSKKHDVWHLVQAGKTFQGLLSGVQGFDSRKIAYQDICCTITASAGGALYHPRYRRHLNKKELSLIGSYPLDYDFQNLQPKYLIGMSVPPVMMAQISYQIYLQWFKQNVQQLI